MDDLTQAIPQVLPPLRGLGPRVFVSYSFSDSELAGCIAAHLEQAGMQVRKEDETSMAGSPLSSTLQSRIGNAEVFVQILTETSVKSAWVKREFEWAVDALNKNLALRAVLPVAVGDVKVPEPVTDWAYLTMSEDPDQKSLDALQRAVMPTVATLPIDPDQPYQFAESELIKYCSDLSLVDRRLIVDPAAVVPGMIRATVAYGTRMKEEYQRQVVAQQLRRYSRYLVRLGVLDAYIPEFVRHVRPMAKQHWFPDEWPHRLGEVVQRFARLAIGQIALDLAGSWSVAVVDEMSPQAVSYCKAAVAEAKALQEIDPGDDGVGQKFWALRGAAGQRWLDLGFDGVKGVEGAYLFLPEDHFDETAISSLTMGWDRPAANVNTTDWLMIGLPQVAASRLPAEPSEVAEIVQYTGWSVNDYRRSGRH